MQGVVFMPENPQQGSPPPQNTTVTDMDISPKDIRSNQSDSGIFSTTTNTTADQTNCDTDNRSDCSSPERKYVCPICDTMLTSQHDFTLHIRSHNNESEDQDNEKGYICRICNKVLSSSSSLDRHVLVHSGERPFHCKYCGDTFTTNGNMHRHMRTHSQSKQESYESDGSVESNLSGSSKSTTEYNNNKVETKCLKRKLEGAVEVNSKRRANELVETGQLYQCPVCERADFNSMGNLETHLEDNHPEYPAKCNQCQQIFSNNKLLTIHRATVHDSPTTKHPVLGFKDLTFVDFSSEKFPHIARRECEINLHKATTGCLKFQCKNCSRAFPCGTSLEIHEKNCKQSMAELEDLRSTHNTEDLRRINFFSRLHLQDNSPEKPQTKLREQLLAKCDNSPKDLADIQSILTNINLQQAKQNELCLPKAHNIDHSETRTEPEEESQDLFAVEFRRMKLRGEFPCRLCTAVFPNLRALKGHNRAHLNGNNNGTYHCNMCPHSSMDKAALIRHMRTHNGDRPYECSLCNYAFTTKANCERHLRNRHAKSTREDVKKAIIYHPSEDPTNEDLNKLTIAKEEQKKLNISLDSSEEKIHCSTPKAQEIKQMIPDLNTLKPGAFPNINDIIRNENLMSLKEHKITQSNGVLPQPSSFGFASKPPHLPPSFPPSKIQVKSLEVLKVPDTTLEYSDDEDDYIEEEAPMDLTISKKRVAEKKPEDIPQDLTKKSPTIPVVPPPTPQFNMGEIFAQQMLKSPPKIDPTALYASQLARLYQNSFPTWPGFPLNPLLFPGMQGPTLSANPQVFKERMQRLQMCGGFISDFNNGFKDNKAELELKKPDELKPLNVEVNSAGFSEGLPQNHQSPSRKPQELDLMQSPNSVKMVIKNGVLMPKQKQRRYRTERPFTCEHCSARFTLRSNMERHIKQQHPQFWSQRQRGNVGNPGRKPHCPKPNYCDLSIPNYEVPKHEYTDHHTKEHLKNAILSQKLRVEMIKKEEEDECALVIDEPEKTIDEGNGGGGGGEGRQFEKTRILEEKLMSESYQAQGRVAKNEESQDLVPVSRLLDNASQQQFKEYFKREQEEHEVNGVGSDEDEEGLVASGSTSEGNVSGTDENRSESETATAPVKKKSAYSLAPNRVSCPYCSRKFPWTSSLRRHILTHTGQKPFKCSHCPLLFTTKSNRDRHLLRKHGNTATPITNDTTSNPNNSNFLIRNVPERPFKCANCPSSTFSTYSNLKKHMSFKHLINAQGDDNGARGYEAGSSEDEKVIVEAKPDWENHKYSDMPVVSSNQSGNNSDLPFKCHLCDGSFSDRQESLDHIRDRHTLEFELLMSKNALDSNATTPDDTSCHQDEEESEIRGKFPDYSNRKVICAFCMRRFWSAEDLRRHMRTHTGERPFSCDICRRRFTLKHSMLRHRKKHNVNFENDNNASDEDGGNNGMEKFEKFKGDNNNLLRKSMEKTDESDGNEGAGDLISNLLGIRDRSIIDKVLTASPDDAAKILGVKNGVRE